LARVCVQHHAGALWPRPRERVQRAPDRRTTHGIVRERDRHGVALRHGRHAAFRACVDRRARPDAEAAGRCTARSLVADRPRRALCRTGQRLRARGSAAHLPLATRRLARATRAVPRAGRTAGRRVVRYGFRHLLTARETLWIAHVDGSNAHVLVRRASYGVVSPDGRWVAYGKWLASVAVCQMGNGTFALFLIARGRRQAPLPA